MLRKNSSGMTDNKKEVKKMRVEQVVTALCKGENLTAKYQYSENNKMSMMTSPIHHSPTSPDSTFVSRKKLKNENIEHSTQQMATKERTIDVIPSQPPLLIRPQAMIPCCPSNGTYGQALPYFPVPRVRGIHIKEKTNSIMKVPRDEKFPFNIYDPKLTSSLTSKDVRHKGKPYTSVKPYKKNPSSKPQSPNNRTSQEYRYVEIKNKAENGKEPQLSHSVSQSNCESTTSKDVRKNSVIQSDNSTTKKKLCAWSVEEVYNYLKTTDCSQYAEIFLEQEIDGQALELLDETNIAKCLGVKMGPAIKLNCTIQKLIKSMKNESES